MKVIESYKEIRLINNEKMIYPYYFMLSWLKENCEPSSFKFLTANSNISKIVVSFLKEEDANLLRLTKSHEFDITVTYFKDLVEITETYVDEQ
jgi:hypothetical protein